MDAGLLVAVGSLIVAEGAAVGAMRGLRQTRTLANEVKQDVHEAGDCLDSMLEDVRALRKIVEGKS